MMIALFPPRKGMFTAIYQKILRIFSPMCICSESAKIKLSHDTKITIIAFRNKKLFFFIFVLLHFYLDFFILFFPENNVPFNTFPAIQNLSELSNMDMVNKSKKWDTEFWNFRCRKRK